MKITRRDDFSLILMSLLAKYYPGKFISLSLAAKETHLSPLFLKHIAQVLKDKGLIKSKEGVGGGYKLKKHPKDISVADIIQASSEMLFAPSCLHGVCRIKRQNCSCFDFWGKINKKMLTVLQNISLSEFVTQ